jgi:hypothetical protein
MKLMVRSCDILVSSFWCRVFDVEIGSSIHRPNFDPFLGIIQDQDSRSEKIKFKIMCRLRHERGRVSGLHGMVTTD